MTRRRFLTAGLLALGILAPYSGIPRGTSQARAADAQVVWQVDKGQFDPTAGRSTVTQTFTPSTSTYLVDVALASNDPGDDIYIQLGEDPHDYTQVTSGEDRFFAVTHLQAGQMPALHLILDPNHDYGGRSLFYAVQVIAIPGLPLHASGVAASRIPNVLGVNVPHAGTYTVHYHLDSGTAQITVLSSAGRKDSGQVSGDGGFTVTLPAALVGLSLTPAPANGLQHWSLSVGEAPTVSDFQPQNNATLKGSPASLSVICTQGARLVLDGQQVEGSYDAASKRLTYQPAQPLAPGLHLLSVVGADGTPASGQSQFLVLPGLVQPASRPAGNFNGQPWVSTSTPDGRYSLLKPASWQMVVSSGTVLLKDPGNGGFIMLSERYLNGYLDAQAVAHRATAVFNSSKVKILSPFQYSGSKDRAIFAGAIKVGGTSFYSVNLVLPELWHYSLGLAFGFGLPSGGKAIIATLARIESSLASNDDAGVRHARRWLPYQSADLNLRYPEGWVANFTGNGPAWFVDPSSGGLIFGLGQAYTGVAGADTVTQVGRQVEQVIESAFHPGLRIVDEYTQSGIYRWLATFPSKDGKSVSLEVGQVAVGNGQLSALWGDTTMDSATVNLPLIQQTLDSVAQAQSLTAPAPAPAASLLLDAGKKQGVDPAVTGGTSQQSGGNPTANNGGAALQLQARADQQNEAYLTLSNLEEQRHETFMTMMGYEYVPVYAGGF